VEGVGLLLLGSVLLRFNAGEVLNLEESARATGLPTGGRDCLENEGDRGPTFALLMLPVVPLGALFIVGGEAAGVSAVTAWG